MNVGRSCFGALYDSGVCYLFGGFQKLKPYKQAALMRESELFRVNTSEWRLLPHMQFERMDFNPCLFRTDIWLCGGRTSEIETFSTVKLEFSTRGWGLHEATQALNVATEDGVVVISVNFIAIWNDGYITTSAHPQISPFSNCTPIVINQKIYSFSEDCLVIDLNSGVEIRKIEVN